MFPKQVKYYCNTYGIFFIKLLILANGKAKDFFMTNKKSSIKYTVK
jgi:hypothetical protein